MEGESLGSETLAVVLGRKDGWPERHSGDEGRANLEDISEAELIRLGDRT